MTTITRFCTLCKRDETFTLVDENCNRALGLLQDSISNLLNAVSYLEGATTIPKGSRD